MSLIIKAPHIKPSCVHRQQEALIRQLLGQPPVRVAQAVVRGCGGG